MKIYQIPAAIRMCFDEAFVDEDGVYHFDEQTFNEVSESAEAKIANCGRYIRETESRIVAMRAAAKDILDRAKTEEKKLDRLKEMTISAIEALGRPVDDADIRVTTRKSEAVEVNEEILGREWFFETVSYKPNKTALKHALKNNEPIEGARLVTNLSLQIK